MPDKKLILIGGGGHCVSVLDAALRMKAFDEIVITDPEISKGTQIMGCEVVGDDSVIPALKKQGFHYAFITVGSIENTSVRRNIVRKVSQLDFEFPVIIDPSAAVSEYAVIGAGTYIGKNAVINAEAEIGIHSIINSGAIIEHECRVGDFSHISVGAVLCGAVTVGNDCFIGAGSTVIQRIVIGNNVIIGANSTVLTNVEAQTKAFGIVKHQNSLR